MKCKICEKDFELVEIEQIFICQHFCHNCNNLFHYKKKSVKIRALTFEVNYLKFYDNIVMFSNNIVLFNFDNYIRSKYIKSKNYCNLNDCINSIEKSKIIVVFNRTQIYRLLEFAKSIHFKKVKCKIVAYEVVGINTRNTQ